MTYVYRNSLRTLTQHAPAARSERCSRARSWLVQRRWHPPQSSSASRRAQRTEKILRKHPSSDRAIGRKKKSSDIELGLVLFRHHRGVGSPPCRYRSRLPQQRQRCSTPPDRGSAGQDPRLRGKPQWPKCCCADHHSPRTAPFIPCSKPASNETPHTFRREPTKRRQRENKRTPTPRPHAQLPRNAQPFQEILKATRKDCSARPHHWPELSRPLRLPFANDICAPQLEQRSPTEQHGSGSVAEPSYR